MGPGREAGWESPTSGVIAVARRVRALSLVAVACVTFFLIVSAASAHVPQFAEGGTSLQTATRIEQPATSWVYYGTLDAAREARYYCFDLAAGDRLYVQLLTPQEGPFPSLAVMGPGLAAQGQLPAFVQAPPGVPVLSQDGDAGAAEYEPFTPGAYWYPATVDTKVQAAGTYYVAVYSEKPIGPYAIAVGYEEKYTVSAWIRLPADLLTIYAWDGGWLSALWPGIAVIVVGAGLLVWRARSRRTRRGLSRWLALAAGIFYLTTSATVLFQMLRAAGRSGFDPAMGVTAFFIIGPAILGALLLWFGWRTPSAPGIGTRVALLVLGIAGFGLLAGYFIGPVLAIAAAAAPPFRREETTRLATR